MTREVRGALTVFGILFVAMAIIPPAFFGCQPAVEMKPLGSLWLTVLFNYQTLIAGILAVGAAYATIIKMQTIDDKQGKRHQQLVELSVRAERNTLERAINPQLSDLKESLAKFESIERIRSVYNGPSMAELDWLRPLGHNYKQLVAGIHNVITRPQLEQGVGLFDGMLTHRISMLKTELARAHEILAQDEARRLAAWKSIPSTEGYAERDDLLSALFNLHRVEDSVKSVVSSLEQAAAKFSVKIT